MASESKEVVTDLSPILRVYKDGTVERISGSPHVPPSLEDPTTGVSSKDINISPEISARLFLPKLTESSNQKLPILVYFHAGRFCLESAFSFLHHHYLNAIVSQAKALAVSVEYRRAPEHPLPAAYEDCWAALQWVASHSVDDSKDSKEPWLINHGDFDRLFIGGDSAGGNIVHNIALRAGVEHVHGDVKILGGFLSHPYFWGSKPLGSDQSIEDHQPNMAERFWLLAYPSAPGGIDNPMINPFAGDAPSLSGLACSRLLMCVAEKDELRVWGIHYVEAVKQSGWKGEVELVDIEGEIHCFHIFDLETEKAKYLIKRLASFIMQRV